MSLPKIRRALAASFIGFAVAGAVVCSVDLRAEMSQTTNYDSNERRIANKWS